MVIILRRLNAISLLDLYQTKVKKSRDQDLIISSSATWTNRIISAFFELSEVKPDESARPHAKYLPPRPIENVKNGLIKSFYLQETTVVKAPVLLPPSATNHFFRVLKDFKNLNLKICSIRLFPQLESSQGLLLIRTC